MTYIQNVQIKTLNCRTGFLILTLYFQEDIGRANIALKAVSLLGVDPVQLSRYTHTHTHTGSSESIARCARSMKFLISVCVMVECTGCSRKIVTFPNPLQPIPCKRSECTLTPIGWPFSVQPIAGQYCQILRIHGEKQIFNCNRPTGICFNNHIIRE